MSASLPCLPTHDEALARGMARAVAIVREADGRGAPVASKSSGGFLRIAIRDAS